MTKQSDILNLNNYKPIHDHGFVGLVDTMPSINWPLDENLFNGLGPGDVAILQAARTSYGKGTKKVSEDKALIRYLMRHYHTTPFEMVETKWHVKLPIIVARQWIRHRTASVNEYSGRYSEMTDEFYMPQPEHIMPQSKDNKQGRAGEFHDVDKRTILAEMQHVPDIAYNSYQAMLKMGVAKELARAVLPVSNYTEWYWKVNLHNLFNFLRLRADPHAQYEIRAYAEVMLEMVRPLAPVAVQAFEDYVLYGQRFSKQELSILRNWLKNDNIEDFIQSDYCCFLSKREKEEFINKIKMAP